MFKCFVLICLLFIDALIAKVAAQEPFIHVVTEDSYPLQYIEDGAIKGPALTLVKQVLKKAGLPFEIKVLPWARAYAIATTKPNILIFSISRTDHREPLFHWIGVLMESNYFLYGLSSKFPLNSNDFIELKEQRIGVINNSATHQHLKNSAFTKLYPVTNAQQLYEKLRSNQIDLMPANASIFYDLCFKFQQDCSNIIAVRHIGLPISQLYFAVSKNTNEKIVNRIQRAYIELLDAGLITEKLK